MKQRITHKELSQLNNKEREILRDWWRPEGGEMALRKVVVTEVPSYDLDLVVLKDSQSYTGYIEREYYDADCDQEWKVKKRKEEFLPLLTIGQMIEFLEQPHKDTWGRDLIEGNLCSHSGDDWCDMLWSAVKRLLEELNK